MADPQDPFARKTRSQAAKPVVKEKKKVILLEDISDLPPPKDEMLSARIN